MKKENAEETEIECKENNHTLEGTDKFTICFLTNIFKVWWEKRFPYVSGYQSTSPQEAEKSAVQIVTKKV